jgi:hypothetical protein
VRFGGERLLPSRRLAIARQDLGRVVRQAVGDTRVERASPARANDVRRMIHASQQAVERGVLGDIGDPHRQRDLLPPRAPQVPSPVPTLGERDEQDLHRARQSEPLGEHLPHLTERDHVRLPVPGRPGEPSCDLNRARRPGAVRIRERAHDRGQELAL